MYLKDLFSKIFKRNVKLITTFLLFHELLIELYIKSFLKDFLISNFNKSCKILKLLLNEVRVDIIAMNVTTLSSLNYPPIQSSYL